MAGQYRRKLDASNTRDQAEVSGSIYSPVCGGQKNLEIGKKLRIMGALDAAKSVERSGATVYCYNSDTAVHFVATGGAAVAAPTDGTDGIPVPPGQYFAIAVGLDVYIISDSALVFGYELEDETRLVYEPEV